MATPFNFNTTAGATEPQLVRAIGPMLADRKWQDASESYANRCAAIKTIINLLEMGTNPTAMSVELTGDFAADFAAVMAECAKNAEPGMEYVWKPLTKKGASALIDWLGQQPWAGSTSKVEEANVVAAKAAVAADRSAATPVTADEVPAGRYAVATEDGAVNTLAFYKVDRPTEGRWAGFVFVKLIVSDGEQRMSKAAGNAILAKIAAVGAEAASAAYGHEIGECGVCGRTLTNDASRERGIGPICVEKMGW